MLWLASCLGVDRRLTVLAACDCAESVLVYVPPGEERPRRAIEVARRWVRGEATVDEVRAAAGAAYDAAYDVERAAAAYASIAAHEAAAAIEAAECMDDPAEAAMYAAQAAATASAVGQDEVSAASAAATASFARSADIVRAHIDAATIASALDAVGRL
jgi:hypothetical protein